MRLSLLLWLKLTQNEEQNNLKVAMVFGHDRCNSCGNVCQYQTNEPRIVPVNLCEDSFYEILHSSVYRYYSTDTYALQICPIVNDLIGGYEIWRRIHFTLKLCVFFTCISKIAGEWTNTYYRIKSCRSWECSWLGTCDTKAKVYPLIVLSLII